MEFLDLTLPTPEENLALDEALLNESNEVLRLWESPAPMVVIGRASRVAEEVDQAECQRRRVPVLRRVTGGAAIVAGPGCLMYAVVLDVVTRPALQAVDQAHALVLGTIADALKPLNASVHRAGTSDLAFRPNGDDQPALKFSGNSVRLTRERLLYHGTILYAADLQQIAALLAVAPRQPEYRRARPHAAFIGSLPASRERIAQALREAWGAEQTATQWPADTTRRLVEERYRAPEWNLGR